MLLRKILSYATVMIVFVLIIKGCTSYFKHKHNKVHQEVVKSGVDGFWHLKTNRKSIKYHKHDYGSFVYIDSMRTHRYDEALISVDSLELLKQ